MQTAEETRKETKNLSEVTVQKIEKMIKNSATTRGLSSILIDACGNFDGAFIPAFGEFEAHQFEKNGYRVRRIGSLQNGTYGGYEISW